MVCIKCNAARILAKSFMHAEYVLQWIGFITQLRKSADADRKSSNDGMQLKLTSMSVSCTKLNGLCTDLTISE